MSQETGSNLESSAPCSPGAVSGVYRCDLMVLRNLSSVLCHRADVAWCGLLEVLPPHPPDFPDLLTNQTASSSRCRAVGCWGGACRHTKTHSPQDRVACLQSHQLSSPWGPLAAETETRVQRNMGTTFTSSPRGWFSLPWQPSEVKVVVTQSCPTLCDPMDWGLPGSSVNGISQARILGWVAILSPRDLPTQGSKLSLPDCGRNQIPKLSGNEITEMSCLTVLEARSPTSRCRQGPVYSGASGVRAFPPPAGLGGCWHPWLEASCSVLCFVSLCVCVFFLLSPAETRY